MTGRDSAEVDFIEELRLRRWARENYVARDQRDASWHPIILEEMHRKDQDLIGRQTSDAFAASKS